VPLFVGIYCLRNSRLKQWNVAEKCRIFWKTISRYVATMPIFINITCTVFNIGWDLCGWACDEY